MARRSRRSRCRSNCRGRCGLQRGVVRWPRRRLRCRTSARFDGRLRRRPRRRPRRWSRRGLGRGCRRGRRRRLQRRRWRWLGRRRSRRRGRRRRARRAVCGDPAPSSMKRAARRVAGFERSQPPALVTNTGRVDGALARARRVERRPVRVDELGHHAVLEGSELPREEVLGGQVLVVAHAQVPTNVQRRQARDRAERPRRRPRGDLGMRVVARHTRVVVVRHLCGNKTLG